MDVQEYLDNAMKAARAETLANSDQLTLGELILKLEAVPKPSDESSVDAQEVVFDFEYLHPTGIDSWRGSYCELAISFDSDGAPMKLSEFISLLKSAIGKTYKGYKGGEYTMSKHTPIWVANYGNSGSTAVIEVVSSNYDVTLITGLREL